ncbi:glycerophosphodiester phosphodiesterase [Anaeromicrobium sediminis]|nr:glycerophosphodiester phosphodiesterase [Anaeromicrobium sediminis]
MKDKIVFSKDTFKDFKDNYKVYITYEAINKAIIAGVLIPLMTIMMNYFMNKGGISVLVNSEIIKFIYSPYGVICVLLMFLISSIGLLSEIGGLIVISKKQYFKKHINPIGASVNALKRFPKIFSLGGVCLLIYFLLLTPFLGIGISTSFINDLSIPSFIEDYLLDSTLLTICLTILVVVGLIISIKSMFVLHITIIENMKVWDSIKISFKLVKKNFRNIVSTVIVFEIFVGMVIGSIIASYALIYFLIIYLFGIKSIFGAIIIGLYTFWGAFLLFLSTFVFTPIHVCMLTRLYFDLAYINENNIPVEVDSFNYNILSKFFKFNKPKLIIFTTFLIFSLVIVYGVVSILMENMNNLFSVHVTAHRGSSKIAPENTLSAIRAAIDEGASFAEIDVQETKDGEIILSHDTNLSRTVGINKNIWDLSYEEMKNYDVGSWFSKEYENERIPLLRDVIRASKDKIKLNIEVKRNGHEKKLIKSLVKLIEEEEFVNECVITSFDYEMLQGVKKNNPNIKTGYVMYFVLGNLEKLNVDLYSMEASVVTKKVVKRIHMAGKEIHVWTVNDETVAEELINMGVDNIITDMPKVIKKVVDRKKEDNLSLKRIIESITQGLILVPEFFYLL